MINYDIRIQYPEFNWKVINQEAKKLADDISLHVQSQVKIALVRAKAIATGATLHSVAEEKILDSPARGIFIRNIVAKETWRFIQSGRKPGSKMPPEAAMIVWFKALNIPKRAWFPIRLSIARKGIKPRKIKDNALRASRPYIAARSKDAGNNIAANLFKGSKVINV